MTKEIKLNGKSHFIPQLSELTFDQFDRVMIKGEVTDLKEYISVFLDMDMNILMNAEFSGVSLPALHQSIFNVNIHKMIKVEKSVVKLFDKHYTISELSHNVFGKNYQFDLYNGLYKRKKISFYKLCIYALAISLSDSFDSEDIEKNYENLSRQVWTKVISQGFFLAKKLSGSRGNLIRLWLICTLTSKAINLKIIASRKRLLLLERT